MNFKLPFVYSVNFRIIMKKVRSLPELTKNRTDLNDDDDKRSLVKDLLIELNQSEDEFVLDGVHFKLSPDENSKNHDPLRGANINQLSKQISDLHKLTFSELKDLSSDDLKNKMKAKILSKAGKKLK